MDTEAASSAVTASTSATPLTVRQASANLWTAKESELHHALRDLHKALLGGSVRSYSDDMANVFLAIQGAALRMRIPVLNNNHQWHTSVSVVEDILVQQWSVLEESLWALAALVRVCVGPAWWIQAERRRRFHHTSSHRHHNHQQQSHTATSTSTSTSSSTQHNVQRSAVYSPSQQQRQTTTPTTFPDDGSLYPVEGSSSSSVQSSSSGPYLTHSIHASISSHHRHLDGQLRNNIHMFPSMTAEGITVDEILPASILRFAAKASHIITASMDNHNTTSSEAATNTSSTASHSIISLEQRMSLVEAQIIIVQHLCCAHHSINNSTSSAQQQQQWNIPGAHETVGIILSQSLKLVCTGRSSLSFHDNRDLLPCVVHVGEEDSMDSIDYTNQEKIGVPGGGSSCNVQGEKKKKRSKTATILPSASKDQWKHILLVTRATTDFLSSGWRPLPQGKEGADAVLALLVIASRGTKLNDLNAAHSAQDTTTSKLEFCEERVLASSCAAEAMAALLSISQRGLIPLEHQSTLVRTVCRLKTILRYTMESEGHHLLLLCPSSIHTTAPDGVPGSSISLEEEEELEHQVEFFASQRELCLADASTLLWTMLSHEAHVETSIEVLFLILQTAADALGGTQDNTNSLKNKLKWNDQTEDYVLADCTTVVRALSTALWGAPELSGIAMLRIFWHSAVEIFCRVISTSYVKFAMTEGEGDAGSFSLIRTNYFIKQVSVLVVVATGALEKVVSVGIDNRGGSVVLSSLEWEATVDGIEKGVLPWLDFSSQMSKNGKDTTTLVYQIESEAMELLIRLAEVLNYYVKTDGFPTMEYTCLKRLLVLLLRGSALLDAERSEQMGVASMHAWSRFGLFPYRLTEWKETAAEILREAFSLKDDGTYFHSGPVRLAALESLTFEKTEMFANTNGTGTLSSQSLLTITQNMGDIHSAIVKECLLPTLRLVLVEIYPDQMPSTNTNGLGLYAVNLAGRLFLSTSADHATRSELVAMLKCISTSTSDVAVRTESSWQLYLCLQGVFCDLPTAHKSIPIIVDAVCDIFQSTINNLIETGDGLYEENISVCFGMLRTLGCLRLRSRNSLAFHNDTALIHSMSHMIASQHQDTTKDRAFGVAMAVFVRADDGNTGKATISSEYTRFSFQPVIEQLVFAIRKINQAGEQNKPEWQSLFAIASLSLEILNTLLIEGVSLKIPPEDLKDVFRGFDAGKMPVVVKTLAMATQSLVDRKQEFSAVLDLLAEYASSASSTTVVASICRGIFPILTSAADKGFDINKICNILQSRLEKEESQFTALDGSSHTIVSLLSVASTRAIAFPESEATRRTFEICLSIVFRTYLEPKSVLLNTALQGALRILASFTQEEAQHSRQSYSVAFTDSIQRADKERERDDAETTFAPLVLKNALDQQSQRRRPSHWEKENEAHRSKSLLQLSNHQRFTVISEQHDRFAVETAGSGGWPTCASWLCCDDSVVLTCRVGSASSRYRGHVEVCLRSPTFHARQLIMIPGKIALEDPEFPLPLWNARSPDRVSTQRDRLPSGHEDYEKKASSTEVLDHAQSLIDRFDSMFAKIEGKTDAEEIPGDNSYNSEVTKDHSDLSAELDRDSVLTDTTGTISISSLLDPSHEVRSIASSYRDDTSIASSHASVAKKRQYSIFDWFIGTFGWNEEEFGLQERLDEYLRPHGLSISGGGSSSVFENYKFQENNQLVYDSKLARAITILDRTATCDTYKFGLLYFKERSLPANEPISTETQLLSMLHCSPAFHEFASSLGTMTPLRHLKYFSAGLDVSEYESDGCYTIAWLAPDETSSVVFHVVNLMPENFNGRKRHIGNDNVLVIFVEETSAVEQLIPAQTGATGANVVSGQFVHATIFVMPLSERNFFNVTCRIRTDLPKEINQVLSDFTGEYLVHEKHVASFVRGLAMRIDLACRTVIDGLPPPTNCLERCRKISELKRYAM